MTFRPSISRRNLLTGSAAIGLLGLVGCGNNEQSGSAQSSAQPTGAASSAGTETSASAAVESGELTIVTPIFEGNDGKDLLDKLIAEFTAQHPGVTVAPDYTSYGKLNEKLTTSITGGTPYDIMIMGVGWVPPFATKNVLMDLGIDSAELDKTYNPRVSQPATYDGVTYGLPIMLDTRFGFYRKDFFEEVGLDPETPPKTFDEIREFGRQLTVRDGSGKLTRAGMDILSNDLRQVYETFMWAAGGELFDESGTATFNSPNAVRALQFMADIILTDKSEDFGYSEPGATTGNPVVNGRAAMTLGHNNLWLQFEDNAPDLIADDKIGMFAITDERPAVFQGGSMATVAAKSKMPNAAKAFAQFLASQEPGLQASEQRGNVPAAQASIDSDYVQNNLAVQFAMGQADHYFSEGGVAHWLDVRGDFKATVESVLLGQTSAQEALDALAAKADSKKA